MSTNWNVAKSNGCLRQYMVIICSKGKDQSGTATNPVGGQLNREKNICFPVPVRALKFDLARRVRPSYSVSACLLSTHIDMLNPCLSTRLLPIPIHPVVPPIALGSVSPYYSILHYYIILEY